MEAEAGASTITFPSGYCLLESILSGLILAQGIGFVRHLASCWGNLWVTLTHDRHITCQTRSPFFYFSSRLMKCPLTRYSPLFFFNMFSPVIIGKNLIT